jgi:hypothetical protein
MRSGIIIAVAAIGWLPLAVGGELNVNARAADGTTPLHWAVHADDLAKVESLLAAGADAKAQDRYGLTPVRLACENANVQSSGGFSTPAPIRIRLTLRAQQR